MTKIKICGLTRTEDAVCMNALRPDYVGFIFAPNRSRTVSHEQAARIRETLDHKIPAVGVFVNASIDEIIALENAGIIQYVQLHGAEDDRYLAALRKRCRLPVIQAFRVESLDDIRRAERSPADEILLDNGAGGTGERFDWSLLRGVRRAFFLAGGLTPENAAEAIAACGPAVLDVSSGVETNGKKDYEKCGRFVRAVRGARTE